MILEALNKRWLFTLALQIKQANRLSSIKITFFLLLQMFPHIYFNARSYNLSSVVQLAKIRVTVGKVSLPRFWPPSGFQIVTEGFLLALIQQSSSTQSRPVAEKPSFPQYEVTKEQKWHMPWEKKTLWKYHFSLLFRARAGCGSVETAVLTYNLNGFTTWPLPAHPWWLNVGLWMS